MMTDAPDAAPIPARRPDWRGAIASAAFAALGAWMVVEALGMTALAAKFPLTVGALMTALALVQVALSLSGRGGQDMEAGAMGGGGGGSLARQLLLVATMIGWALLFPRLGMFVTSLAASVILTLTAQFGPLGARRAAFYLIALLVMVTGFWLLMARVLNIPLPPGLFF